MCSACPAVQGEVFHGPAALPPTSTVPELAQGVQQLLDVMVANGFALKVQQQKGCHGSTCLRQDQTGQSSWHTMICF